MGFYRNRKKRCHTSLNHNPETMRNPSHNRNANPSPKQTSSYLPYHVTKTFVSLINTQGSVLTIYHEGDPKSASKNA